MLNILYINPLIIKLLYMPVFIITHEFAKNCTTRRALRVPLHHLPQVSDNRRPPRGCHLQPTAVPDRSRSLQSFIIFVGMSAIACLRPWMKPQGPKSTELPTDNMNIYIMPSLLDVLGTIVDTSGLYYVLS